MTADQLHIGGTPELEAWTEEQEKDAKRRAIAARRAPQGFDPAAVFLLDLLPENLYDPTDARGSSVWRCKGCGALIPTAKRADHHRAHKTTADHRRTTK